MRVSLLQSDLVWQSPEENRQQFEAQFAALEGTTDLAVLPEMFTTGFSMQPEVSAETFPGPTLTWMQQCAARYQFALCGSVACKLDAGETGYVNRFLFVRPDGSYDVYDKRHLFRMGGEHQHYDAGQTRVVIDYMGWRILPIVCYDLRFPVWSRNQNDYDLMICVANWPEPRRLAWRALLTARAIENQCYVAGVNRIGTDGMNLNYSGDSMLINYKGETELDYAPHSAGQTTVALDQSALAQFRDKFPAWMDADPFQLA